MVSVYIDILDIGANQAAGCAVHGAVHTNRWGYEPHRYGASRRRMPPPRPPPAHHRRARPSAAAERAGCLGQTAVASQLRSKNRHHIGKRPAKSAACTTNAPPVYSSSPPHPCSSLTRGRHKGGQPASMWRCHHEHHARRPRWSIIPVTIGLRLGFSPRSHLTLPRRGGGAAAAPKKPRLLAPE
jgi:hypothetical protein